MLHIVENEYLKVSIKSSGAEITSIISKKDNTEYMWQAEPKIWGRHAPVLFPIVGMLKDGRTNIDEKEYFMSRHGFARDMIFDIISSKNNSKESSVIFRIQNNQKTEEQYPYKFLLEIEYILCDSSLDVIYRVINNDNQKIYFNIGSFTLISQG